MNKRIWMCLALLALGLLLASRAATRGDATVPGDAPASSPSAGVQVAQAISTITGVAISPLLGVSAVGAWKYLHAPSARRGGLPWFAQPWFWIPGLLIVGLCFAKDVMGPAVPIALKKPLDALEVFENKFSGLIAAGAFVPLIASLAHAVAPPESWLSGTGLAAFDPALLVNILTVPAAMIAFVLVWMVAHVINVLIVVSPFATVDAALKSARLALLSTVTLTAFAHPYVGAAWALGLMVLAYFLAGWSFRLTVFGTVFAWDLLTFRFRRFRPKPKRNWMFTARRLNEVPVRSYGQLIRDEPGRLTFRYRPLLVLSARSWQLPEGSCAVGRGLLFPELLRTEGDAAKTVMLLPPRYRTHEETLTGIYALSPVRDLGLVKRGKAVWQWLKTVGGLNRKTGVAAGTAA